MAARGYIFEGSLYMARFVGGAWQNYTGPLEGSRFEMKPNVDRKEMISRGRGSFGQVLESVLLQQPTDFAVTLNEGTPEVLAAGLMGTTAVLAQTSGSLTAETITAALDKWVPVSKANLTGSPTLTNTAATTTYINGTDYIVNPQLGMVKALVGGAIADAASLKFTSTYGAITGTQILGSTTADVRVRFKLDGRSLADGSNVVVTVHEAIIAAEAAVDFLSGEFIGVPLTGRMKTPAGFTSPYTVDLRTTG